MEANEVGFLIKLSLFGIPGLIFLIRWIITRKNPAERHFIIEEKPILGK